MRTAVVVALLSAAAAAPAPEVKPLIGRPKLRLTIHLGKETYKAGDAVKLVFDLSNDGDATAYIGDGFLAPDYHEVGPLRHFELSATVADGPRLRFWSGQQTEGTTSGVRRVFLLPPGKSYSGEVVLSEGAFATEQDDKKHALGKDAKKYQIALQYRVADNFGLHEPPDGYDPRLLWKGELTSNEIALTFE
jgi:hypothetical protein